MKAPETNTNNRTDFIANDSEFEILRAYKFQSGDISFDLKIRGVTIYGCVLKWSNRNNHWFVSWPSRKDNDGAYYKHAYAPLTDADTKRIEDAVEARLAE